MKFRAFTIVELLACIVIISVVAAISFPVVASAKRSALERQSCSDLRQIAISALLYREDWKKTEYGDMADMGLPEDYSTLFGVDTSKRPYKPTPQPPIVWPNFPLYYWMPLPSKIDGRPPLTWAKASLKYEEKVLLVSDPAFEGLSDGRPVVWDFSLPNRINGVNLGGELIKKKAYGEWDDFTRWVS